MCQEWDILRLEEVPRPVPAALPAAPVLPQPLLPQVSYQEFIVDAFQPAAYVPYGGHYGNPSLPPAYHSYPGGGQLVAHPTAFYAQTDLDPKRHTVRSPVSGKFVRTEPVKRPLQVLITFL